MNTKDNTRFGFKVGDLVQVGSGFMGRCWNEGLVGVITGFDDAPDGAYSHAHIDVQLKERVDTRRLSQKQETT